MATGPTLFSVNGLAAELQLDRRTLARRLAGLAPAASEGGSPRYLLADALQHMSGQTDAAEQLARERTRLAAAQALKVEIENSKRAGLLVEAAEVERAAFIAARELRDRILAVPARVAAEVAAVAEEAGPRAVEGFLTDALRVALQGAADDARRRAGGRKKAALGTPKEAR